MKVTAACSPVDGGWWFVRVPEVPGALTQVRSIDDAGWMAADAVATLIGMDPQDIDVRVVVMPEAASA